MRSAYRAKTHKKSGNNYHIIKEIIKSALRQSTILFFCALEIANFFPADYIDILKEYTIKRVKCKGKKQNFYKILCKVKPTLSHEVRMYSTPFLTCLKGKYTSP